VQLPNYGTGASEIGAMAAVAESAGFDSVWLSDHVVLVADAASRYPFSSDGKFFLAPSEDWFEWAVTAGYLACATHEVEIGVGVAVLPLRHPLLLAKQVATLDRLSGGRIVLGVGAGWLTEEMRALGVEPAGRGVAMDEGLRLLRAAWAGNPASGRYGRYELPEGVWCRPVPVRDPLPVFVGGGSRAVARRVARWAQGWFGSGLGGAPTVDDVVAMRQMIAQECVAIGRDPAEVETALRVSVRAREIGSGRLAEQVRAYAEAGVTRISFDLSWARDPRTMEGRLVELRAAVASADRRTEVGD
jgi:probable F420-dependent oxidoreductase